MAWKYTKQGTIKKTPVKKQVGKCSSGNVHALLASAATRANIKPGQLHEALLRRGAITEHILDQLVDRFEPMMQTRGQTSFTGRSVTSIVPVVLRRGRISPSALRSLANAFENVDAKHWKRFTKQANRPEREAHFRSRETVIPSSTNGGSWKVLAPQGVQDFISEFLQNNRQLVEGIKQLPASRQTYRHLGETRPVFEQPRNISNNLFAYVQMSSFPEGASDTWHCDGGPSMVFMAVSVQGERILQIEDAVGKLTSIHLHEGDVYVSTPCSFWHSVKPIGRKPSKTLILRSSILKNRYSGGRNNSYRQTDKGTTGYPMETKEAFENMAEAMSDLLRDVPIRFNFHMK